MPSPRWWIRDKTRLVFHLLYSCAFHWGFRLTKIIRKFSFVPCMVSNTKMNRNKRGVGWTHQKSLLSTLWRSNSTAWLFNTLHVRKIYFGENNFDRVGNKSLIRPCLHGNFSWDVSQVWIEGMKLLRFSPVNYLHSFAHQRKREERKDRRKERRTEEGRTFVLGNYS